MSCRRCCSGICASIIRSATGCGSSWITGGSFWIRWCAAARRKRNRPKANYEQAKAQTDKDYEETAAAVAEKKQLTAEEEAELSRLWKKLVKLYHPDRFANEPDKLETYHKLTAAINRAKDAGDIKTLREIAEDPHGFILRQGWATLDFSDEAELAQLRRLHETLQLEIIAVLESLNRLRESPDYELCQLSEQKPGVLDELAAGFVSRADSGQSPAYQRNRRGEAG